MPFCPQKLLMVTGGKKISYLKKSLMEVFTYDILEIHRL